MLFQTSIYTSAPEHKICINNFVDNSAVVCNVNWKFRMRREIKIVLLEK